MKQFDEPKLIEGHDFTPKPPESKDDYRCAKCGHPRALHERTGFTPSQTPSALSSEGSYRNFKVPEGMG